MNMENLDKAAREFVAFETKNPGYDECIRGFKRGALWLREQSLSDKLTDSEKAKVLAAYKQAEIHYNSNDDTEFAIGLVVKTVLKGIFGTDIFDRE